MSINIDKDMGSTRQRRGQIMINKQLHAASRCSKRSALRTACTDTS